MNDDSSPPPLLSIGELADKTGVSRRTVRYYVQRGLIHPPIGLGRTSGYNDEHVDQILRVLRLQREGMDLDTIEELPAEAGSAAAAKLIINGGVPTLTLRVPVIEGVRLEYDVVGNKMPPPDVVKRMILACRQIMQGEAPPAGAGE